MNGMNTMPIDRTQIISAFTPELSNVPFIRAAWLGGSDATGRTDQWSDVDLALIVEDERVEDAFDEVHRALETLAPLTLVYRFPTPTWHGHEQEMIRVRDANPFAIVDVVVMKKSSDNRFLEVERHGNAFVLFDHDGLVKPASLDRAAHREKLRMRMQTLRSHFELGQVEVRKAALRGAAVEAAYLYQVLCIRPLVEVLRMRHCPDRYDYGPRYLDRDLPEHVRERLIELACPSSTNEVSEFQAAVESMFKETLETLDCRSGATNDRERSF
jgi:predicted nucleotidyltransferase